MRISDWSSDVCSSDLLGTNRGRARRRARAAGDRERLAVRALALERGDGQSLCGGGLGDELILAGIGLEIFELQLHLREETLAAFCAGSVRVALRSEEHSLNSSH